MRAECAVRFRFSPLTAAWATDASLRLNAELLGYRHGEAGGSPEAECAAAQLQVLLYVSRFHQLHEVSLEEAVEEVAEGPHLAPSPPACATAESEAECTSSPINSLHRSGVVDQRRVLTVLHDFSWRPSPHPIKHTRLRNTHPLASSHPSSSDAMEQTAGKLDSFPGARGPAETPQALFSTLLSTIPSSVGAGSNEEEGEEGEREAAGDRDQLVLQFDSLSASSTDVQEVAAPSEGGEEEMVKGEEETKQKALIDAQPKHLPGQEAAPSPPRPSSVPTAEVTPAAVAAPPQRRLLLLRPGSAKEEAVPTPATEVSCADTASSSQSPSVPIASTMQRRRVLNINAAAKPPQAAQASVPPTEAPPLPPSTTDSLFVEAPAPVLLGAAASPLTDEAAKNEETRTAASPREEEESWTPYIFSFTYDPSSHSVANAAALVDSDGDVQVHGPQLRRRLIAVHLSFNDAAAVHKTTSCVRGSSKMRVSKRDEQRDAAQTHSHALRSRASVATCGWFTGTPACSSTASQLLSCRDSGYAFITGDASLHTCWICPLVASIFEPAGNGLDADKEDGSECKCAEGSPLLAGPLLDVWVSAVSADVSAQRVGCSTSSPSAQALHTSVKKELFDDENRSAAFSLSGDSCPAWSALPCLHFTPSWLSQLSCIFAPPRVSHDADGATLAVTSFHERESGVSPRRATCVQWPSTIAAGLTWTASQTTADCIVLRPSFPPAPSSALEASDFEVRGDALCVCLRSDVYLMDAIYAYFQKVKGRWWKAMKAATISLAEAPLARSACDEAKPPQIVLTRIAPASLSLRGGAAGSVNGVLLAEETACAADFAGRTGKRRMGNRTQRSYSTAALRARVAVTAAILQYFLWQAVETSNADSNARTANEMDRKGAAEAIHTRESFPPTSQSAADLREEAIRIACVARALALQWVCSDAAVTHTSANVTQQFVAEEMFILTSASAVGRLLQPSGFGAAENQRESSAAALQILRSFQQRYTTAAFTALSWLSRSTKDLQWLQRRGVATAGFLADQQRLCRWALQPYASSQKKKALSFASQEESENLPWCNDFAVPRFMKRLSRTCIDAPASASGDGGESGKESSTPLVGTIGVRIQHTPVLNALHIQLDWKVTSPCSATGLAAITGTDAATAVELPFVLLVFVLQEKKAITAGDSPNALDGEEHRDDTSNGGGSNETMVRLYQATPFSWYLPVQNCTTAGSTAHVALSVMHALDLVARRPDAFEGFNVQTVTGLGTAMQEEMKKPSREGRRGGAVKRRRAAKRRNPTEPSTLKGALRGSEDVTTGTGKGRPKRGQATGATARKRRRTRRSADSNEDDTDSNDSDSDRFEDVDEFTGEDSAEEVEDSKSDDDEAFAVDVGYEDGGEDEDGTLFLNLGSGAGRKAGKSATSAGRRGATGHVGAGPQSVLDTARVIPLIVLRKDCTAPFLEVEVRYAELLAAGLLAAGYGSDATTRDRENSDDFANSTGATAALCNLLSHLTGFATVHAANSDLIVQLRARQECASLLSVPPTTTSYAEVSALTEPSVLCAYTELFRGALKALTGTGVTFTALVDMVAVDRVLSNVLSATNTMQSVQGALNEYARQDAACRACLLSHEWESGSDVVLETSGIPSATAATTTTRKRNSTKAKQQQQLQQKVAEQRSENEVQDTWTPDVDAECTFLSTFYNCVLPPSFRSRRTAVRRLLSNREDAATDLDKWTCNDKFPSCLSYDALKERMDVLQRCVLQSESSFNEHAQVSSPAAMPHPTSTAAPSALRLQLRTLSVSQSAAAPLPAQPLPSPPAHLSSPVVASSIVGPTPPNRGLLPLSRLCDLCGTHLGCSAASFSGTEKCGGVSENANGHRLGSRVSSHEAIYNMLSASADALLTGSPARHFSSAKTAAASLGLSVAQLASSELQGWPS
ncbi:hypothetical protein ABB37_02832 [Leptomonas pyrrhocoris]|uniref:Uncharacterized protein n=1 Tax=Leptomonas pyrrhocoris TaxID=157538 RepID=A0A0N0VGB7_LEPPY|nr:hypothetical protein ABB37_02832 [Leptomonas pyrrhocoris]KPA83134.1 hypothetical protein ABB37_02832 [Leptomonas pyrrhocoris]|eukprot:XP_015661573.1 hypothetical protein ABB37_02832 [Leptomonas pyrrhocoris]